MKKNIAKVFAVVAAVVVAAVLMSRPRSDSESTKEEERMAQPPNTKIAERESVAKSNPSPVNPEPAENIASVPLDDMQSTTAMMMKVDAIQKEPDLKEWPGMLFDLMHEASMEEIMELLAISEDDTKFPLGLRDSMKAAAYERWYYLEPAAAIRAMDASTLSASQKNSRMEVFLEDWSSQSPQEVKAFLEQGLLTDVSSDLTYGALVRGSALNGDRDVVGAALDNIVDPKLRFYAIKSAARSLRRDHGDQFEDWLGSLPTEDQNVAIAEGAWIIADKDINQALAGLERLNERGASELAVTRLRVAVKWMKKDPVAAADWVAVQDVTGEDREVLFANVIRVWVSKDRGAAVDWIESLIEKGEIDEAFMNRVAGRM